MIYNSRYNIITDKSSLEQIKTNGKFHGKNLSFFRFRIRKNMWWTYYRSMEDDKEKLSALGDRLSATMQSITSNFRLGFGSFVDKVVMPYVSTVPRK